MEKRFLKNINGIFLLNKPIGLTSNAALQKVKRLFVAKKAGHTGSLDPLATGMLPICFGEATKFSQFLLDSDKCYQVTAALGTKTTTGDVEGMVLQQRSVPRLTESLIEEVLSRFRGLQSQIPPMFSAIKHQGKPLYELARQGIEIDRQPRSIHIYRLILLGFDDHSLTLEVQCSKGTYVRTLVEDIGEALGCGAHVSALHRSVVFPYLKETMYTMDELLLTHQALGECALQQWLLPAETSVAAYPAIHLKSSDLFYIRTGQEVRTTEAIPVGNVRLYTQGGEFLGVGEIKAPGLIAPRRLVSQ